MPGRIYNYGFPTKELGDDILVILQEPFLIESLCGNTGYHSRLIGDSLTFENPGSSRHLNLGWIYEM